MTGPCPFVSIIWARQGDAMGQEEATVEIQSKQLSRLQPCKCYEMNHDLAQNSFMVHNYWLDSEPELK